ncbi:MAG: hypothetical protein J1E34_03065 [Oscillospiraceae bacterium]|nr:hypothetical protein [Oscillospiraceae bacterium]
MSKVVFKLFIKVLKPLAKIAIFASIISYILEALGITEDPEDEGTEEEE